MDAPQIGSAISLLRRARYVVALTGAGISTRSGIPDFRTPHSGLWEHVNPMDVASVSSFRRNPAHFYEWIRPLAHTILAAEPNPAHHALTRLEAIGKLKSIITQNIDMLHTMAGSQTVYEVHGSLREATCIHCFATYSIDRILAHITDGHRSFPTCPDCGHALKPNVILFGEQLPAQTVLAAQREALRCDVMLIVGSSLEVFPSAQWPSLAQRHGAALIIVNLTPTPLDAVAQVVFHADAAEVLPLLATALESPEDDSP